MDPATFIAAGVGRVGSTIAQRCADADRHSRGRLRQPDGQRFFVVQQRPAPPLPPVTHINLVLNRLEELKAKVPTRR